LILAEQFRLEYEQSLTQPLTKYPQEVIVYK